MATVDLGPLPQEPLDPSARCVACGALGTVGITVIHTEPATIERFCEPCWPAARERFERDHEEVTLAWMRANLRAGPFNNPPQPPGTSVGSRSWFDVGQFLDRHVLAPDGTPAIGPEDLAGVVREIRRSEAGMYGPMPARIRAFVDRYGA